MCVLYVQYTMYLKMHGPSRLDYSYHYDSLVLNSYNTISRSVRAFSMPSTPVLDKLELVNASLWGVQVGLSQCGLEGNVDAGHILG